MNLADLKVRVGWDGGAAERGLANLGQQVDATGRHYGRARDSALGFLTAGYGQQALNGLFRFGGEALFGFNGQLEQAKIGFSTMLGSAGAADEFLTNLEDFASRTPFEFPELIGTSQKLLAMGFRADEVVPKMTAIGDAVAALGGNSETVDRVGTAMGQMLAKGKVSAEEMMQLTEAGIPGWQMLADAMGVSTGELQDMVSDGAVPAREAVDMLAAGMETNFGGMMEQQSKTFQGAMSTIKDNALSLLAKGLRPLFDIASAGALKLATFLSEDAEPMISGFFDRLKRGAERLRELFGPVLGAARELVEAIVAWVVPELRNLQDRAGELAERVQATLVPILRDLADRARAVYDVARDVVTAFMDAGLWSGAFADQVARLAELLLGVPVSGDQVTAVMVRVRDTIASAGDMVRTFGADAAQWMGTARDAAEQVGSYLADTLGPMITDLVDNALVLLTDAWQSVAEGAANLYGFVSDYWGQIVEAVRNALLVVGVVVAGALQLVKGLWNAAGDDLMRIVGDLWQGIKDLIGAAAEAIQGVVQVFIGIFTLDWDTFWSGIKNIASGVWDALRAIIGTGLDVIRGIVGAGVSVLQRLFVNAWNGIKNAAVAAFGALIEWLRGLGDRLREAIGNLAATLVAKGRELINGLRDGVQARFSDLVGWLSGIPGRVTTAVGNLARTLHQLGRDLISGFLNGIRERWDDLTGWIAGAADHLPGFIKGPLGISSPSRVFMAIGQDTIEGLERGVAARWGGELEPALARMAGQLGGAFTVNARPSASSPSAGASLAGGRGGGQLGGVVIQGDVVLHGIHRADQLLDELQALSRRHGGLPVRIRG